MTSNLETEKAYSGFGTSYICHLFTYLNKHHLLTVPGAGPGATNYGEIMCKIPGLNLTGGSCVFIISRQTLRYTVLGPRCIPLLQCLGRLSLPPSVRR